MIETKNGGGVAIDSTQLLEWIAVHEDQIKRDHARFVRNRDYDLCRIMDGHADAMWQLREWLKWTHNIVPSNSNASLDRPAASAGTVGGLVRRED